MRKKEMMKISKMSVVIKINQLTAGEGKLKM
jgi:hypothetical protein